MAFSASDAALEGFHIVRREPRAVAGWSVVQLIFGIAVTVATVPFMQPLMDIQATRLTGGALTPAQTMAVLEPTLGFLAVLIPLELVVVSVLGAAVYRVVLRPGDQGLTARLRLGGDELRLAILWIELGFLFWIVGFVVLVAVATVGLMVGAAMKTSPAGAVVTVMISYLVVLAVMVWLAVRFSLAAPMTFATRKVQLVSAWRLTRGRFWPLFSCYLLTFVFVMIILMAQLCIVAVVSLIMSGGSLTNAAAQAMRPDYSSLAAYLTPTRIVGLLFNSLLGGVYWSVALAPAAVAYKEFAGQGVRPSA